MTLIIGCISDDFGIIAGDTQLTRTGLLRKNKRLKEIEIKIGNYSTKFLMGILGNWSSWHGEGNKATYTNLYDFLKENLPKENNSDQLQYVKDFLGNNKEEREATAIFIELVGEDFSLGHISTENAPGGIKELNIEKQKFLFNEPYYKINDNLIESNLLDFKEKYQLEDTLVETLFLLNNLIIDMISKGDNIDILTNEGTSFGNLNTVGGYVTLQVLTRNRNVVNSLYLPYNRDYNCLLDRTTHPFSKYLNQNLEIRYIDNLAMLIKNCNSPQNENICKELRELVIKQLNYLANEKLVREEILNEIVKQVNKIYSLKLQELDCNRGKNDDHFVEVLFDEERPVVDVNFLCRFF